MPDIGISTWYWQLLLGISRIFQSLFPGKVRFFIFFFLSRQVLFVQSLMNFKTQKLFNVVNWYFIYKCLGLFWNDANHDHRWDTPGGGTEGLYSHILGACGGKKEVQLLKFWRSDWKHMKAKHSASLAWHKCYSGSCLELLLCAPESGMGLWLWPKFCLSHLHPLWHGTQGSWGKMF